MKVNKQRLLFVVNPISGGKSKKRLEEIIRRTLDLERFSWVIKRTAFAGHALEIVKEEAADYDAVIAVGGDGTINEIASELSHTTIPMGIIPLGSGNGLARHLKIPLDVHKAIDYLNHALPQEVDTLRMNGHFFVSIAGVGFDSLIASEFEKQKGRGFVNYAKLTIREFFHYQENEFNLNIDGQKYRRKAHLISFANSNQFGYRTIISPQADISDGLVDVCIITKPKLWQIPRLFLQMWMERADQSSLVEIIRGKEIELWPNNDIFANIDGESVKVGEKIQVKLFPKSLKIMMQKK